VDDRELWWPENRRGLRVAGMAMGLLWLLSAVWDGWDGEWSSALLDVPGIVIAGLMVLGVNRWRVETDSQGVRVVGLFRSTFVPWSGVAEIRGNAAAKSTYLVLVARSGKRLRLPLNPTTHRRLVALWQEIAARERPQQAG
jgi:hypothetical protein